MGTIKQITALFLTLVFTPTLSFASPEIDRVYQLESLAWLKPADNVDGIFVDYLDEQFTNYFKKQSRFTIRKLNGVDALFGKSSTPYRELIQNRELIRKVAQKFRVENLLRSQVYKEAETYRIVLEWVYAPKGDILAKFEFRYVDPQKDMGLEGSDLPDAIDRGLTELIARLPFLGQVTGVEGDVVTVNLGRNQGISRGEIYDIQTLDSVRRHPMLNTIEEWRWEPVAKAQVEQVDESMSFAKIIEVDGEHPKVLRFQKIKEILPAPKEKAAGGRAGDPMDIPRIGWVAGNLGIGTYSREVGAGGAAGRSGGGLLGNLEVDTQVWLNSRFIAQASLMQSFFKYKAEDLATGVPTGGSYSGDSTQFRLAGGYSFFPARTVFDAIAWVHAGYRSTSYSLPTQNADLTASSNIGSFFVGVGGEVPIQAELAAQLGIDIGLLRSGSSTNLGYGSVDSASDLMFSTGLSYHYEERLFLRVLFKLNSQSLDFASGQTVSQKMFTVAPSVMYYF